MDLVTAIEIAAPAEAVWAVVTDLAAYPAWNPLILAARGRLAPGGRLRLREHVYRRVVLRVTVEVVAAEPPWRLAWRGGLRPAGLFAVRREVRIEPLGGGRVRFLNAGTFSGILLPLFARGLTTHLQPKLEAMNRALTSRVESRAARGEGPSASPGGPTVATPRWRQPASPSC